MGNILHRLVLKPGYLKDQYLDHYYFWSLLIICLMVYQQMLSFLLLTHHFFSVVHNMNKSKTNYLNKDLKKSETGQFSEKWNLKPIQAKKLRKLHFQQSFKRRTIIQFVLIRTLLKKFSLRNILEYILILNWIFRST